MDLTILHTNDMHGHITPWQGTEGELAGRTIGGFDRLATVVKKVRAETKHVLLLDAGDAWADTLVAQTTKGKAVLDLMNAVGYDSMTLGNHEPDFGPEALRKRISEAAFAIVAANVLDAGTGQPITKPYVKRDVGGLTVGILGIAYANTPLTTARCNTQGLMFLQGQEAASEQVPRLRRDGVQILIVLSHLGLGADRKLAENVRGIDFILGGPSHNRMHDIMRVGATIIVQAGAHLSDVGRLDLSINGNGRIVGAKRRLILLDAATMEPEAELRDEVARIIEGVPGAESERDSAKRASARFVLKMRNPGVLASRGLRLSVRCVYAQYYAHPMHRPIETQRDFEAATPLTIKTDLPIRKNQAKHV